ncbi:MAG: PatB family C-S lyase [Bacteroidales bacterium]|nr:PatB family C-S lyase [Bacteroidales bacterium]
MKKYNFDEIIPREGTNSVKYDFRKRMFGKEDVIPMWVADMDFRTPDFVMEAIRQRTNHEILGYTIRPDSFYEAIINWNRRKHGWEIQKDWISFSPGVVPAVNMAIMAFSSPGDKIIVQPPVYHPFFHSIENHGREILRNHLKLENGRFNMDFEDLRKKIDNKTSMILLSSPHNPGGSVWHKSELEELGHICKENGVTIISDEIHADLILFENKHTPLASISKELADITVTTMAPSKTFNLAGMSTSYVIASNPELLKKYNKALEKTHVWHGNIFGSIALQAAYNKGSDWLEQVLDYIEENINLVDRFFRENLPEVKVIIPEATYLVMLDFRQLGLSNKELKRLMIEEAGVGMNDGASFGKEGDGFQRMNVSCPRAIVEKALHNIEKAIKKNKS